MYGRNVNFQTVEIIDEQRKLDDPNAPDLIIDGSCGLHMELMERPKTQNGIRHISEGNLFHLQDVSLVEKTISVKMLCWLLII